MSKQPTTSAASDEEKFQALQCIIKRLEKSRECLSAFSRQRIHSEALRDAMQDAFLEALRWGAFAGPRWAALYIGYGNPNEPKFSNLLRYAKEEEYIEGLWDIATKGPYPYKDVIDEGAGQLIELLRQEAAARAENGGGGKADPPKAPAEGAASPCGAGQSEAAKRFVVALSFPGERRAFVKEVAELLSAQFGKARVLYDKFHEPEFAQPNLDIHLQRLYHDESELIVVFLSADYQKKEWCGLEWRAIRDLIKKGRSSAIMLLRFDDAQIPGIYGIDGCADIRNCSPPEVADRILERLRPKSLPHL